MKKTDFSATLSLVLTVIAAVCLVGLCVLMPWLADWYYADLRGLPQVADVVTVTYYLCVPVAATAIYFLARLLINIRAGSVFTGRNVSMLRGLSWCCVAAAMITAVAGCWYLPLLIIFAAAGFMAIILRVVKNAFEAAVQIKSENDLTI